MFKDSTEFVIVFTIISVILILVLVVFIATILYKYQRKQNAYYTDIELLKDSHKNILLQSQLEIQEQTFQNISREIHDSIGQKLTLAKLQLNTLDYFDTNTTATKVLDAVNMISQTISDLTDLSRSMSSEILLNNGLINALEFEAAQLQKSGLFQINISTTGNSIFMDTNKELIIFRIVQELINNIIKHANATSINIELHYNTVLFIMSISDNGKGFVTNQTVYGTGLQNIKKRTLMLNGTLQIDSLQNEGAKFKIQIPMYENINSI